MKEQYQELRNPPEPQSAETRHILVHMPDKSARWTHLENLDEFFRRVYEYHQRGGFLCMVFEDFLEVVQFVFLTVTFTVLTSCVDYGILFRDKFPRGFNRSAPLSAPYKVSIHDAWIPHCGSRLSFGVVLVLIVAVIFGVVRLLRAVVLSARYYEIRSFYHDILQFHTSELTNLTWYQIQQRLCDAQLEHQLCIHKRTLTELDIYQRVLRYDNYMVALFNKEHFPPKLRVNLIDDELVFFSSGLKFNLEVLLFWGPYAPWESYWHVDAAVRHSDDLPGLTRRIQGVTLWLGLINLLLSPLVFIWQILNTFCMYTDLVRRDPSVLGARKWSMYARFYLRHFNELEHELQNRLNRAYRPSTMYMDLFISPLTVVIAKNVMFFAGGALAVLVGLTVIDEDVLQIEHLFTAMTILTILVAGARGILPDENQIFCPELLLNQILAHIHYMPDSWRHFAHTTRVRQQFCQLFQYKVVWILMELLSPLVTPFVLIFWIKPRIGQILEFFHNYTVQVPGLGDVCSFSQMDIARHGSDKWKPADGKAGPKNEPAKPATPFSTNATEEFRNENKTEPAALGKTEISLLHFAITNPTWNPPVKANNFLKDLRKRAVADGEELQRIQAGVLDNPLLASLTSVGCFYNPVGGMAPIAELAPLGSGRSMCLRSTVLGGPPGPSEPRHQQSDPTKPLDSLIMESARITPGDLADSHISPDSPLHSPMKFRGPGVRTLEGPPAANSMNMSHRSEIGARYDPGEADHLNVGMPASAGSSLVLGSLQASGFLPTISPYAGNVSNIGEMDNYGAVCEMTMSVMYLHEIHRRRVKGRNYGSTYNATAGHQQRSTNLLSRYRFDNRAAPPSGNFIQPYSPESEHQDAVGIWDQGTPERPGGIAPIEMYQVERRSGDSSHTRSGSFASQSSAPNLKTLSAGSAGPPVPRPGLPLEHLCDSDSDSDADERPPTEFKLG